MKDAGEESDAVIKDESTNMRKGECNNCGWCCQFEAVHQCTASSPDGQPLSLSDQTFYTLRGGTVHENGKQVRYLMYAYLPCEAHVADQGCSIYENRPDICRNFPSSPEQIEGSPCSYWFETEENGKLVQRGGKNSPYPTDPKFT